jgi:DNA-binding response OmpR family regulator
VSSLENKIILIIDDDPLILRLLEYSFSRAGAQVHTAANGSEGLRLLRAQPPHLVILDIMMPEMDGWEVCSRIRQISDVPIIFLSALGGEDDIVRGLEDGAIDYVPKPASPKVLLGRARAALRQAELAAALDKPLSYRDEYLVIDLGQNLVVVNGKAVKLNQTESRLLAYLLQNAGRILTFQQILDHVWGLTCIDSATYVHVYVVQLRQKLEADPTQPRYLLSERGVGYRFRPLPAANAASHPGPSAMGESRV